MGVLLTFAFPCPTDYTSSMARHPINIRSGRMTSMTSAFGEYLAEGGATERSKSGLAAEIWPQIVGHWYARHSCVVALKKKELQVYCDNPALAQQLQLDQETIIGRLNERLGGNCVTSLRPSSAGPRQQRDLVRAQKEVEPEGPTDEELAQVALPEADRQALEELAGRIEDEKLRATFVTNAEAYLRLQEWRRLRAWRQCPECGCRHEELTELCFACRVMRGQPYLG